MFENYQAWLEKIGFNKDVKIQYSNSANSRLRRNLQERAEDGRDLHKEVFDALELDGQETILDEGCGDGGDLFRLATDYGHQGKLVGMEVPILGFEDRFIAVESMIEKLGVANVPKFIAGRARRIPLPDNSIDVALLFSMLYEEKFIKMAMYENQRILIPGGKVALITNGINNRQRLHSSLRDMGAELGCKPPAPFSDRFNLAKAYRDLPKYFGIVKKIEQNSRKALTDDDIPDFLGALDSYRQSFPKRTHKQWVEARKKVVEEPLRAEMEANGGVVYETVHWGAIIMVNDRPTSYLKKLAGLALAS